MVTAVLVMLAGCYTVYVFSPYQLVWHMPTSADRLLTQLWPPLVVATFWAHGGAAVDAGGEVRPRHAVSTGRSQTAIARKPRTAADGLAKNTVGEP